MIRRSYPLPGDASSRSLFKHLRSLPEVLCVNITDYLDSRDRFRNVLVDRHYLQFIQEGWDYHGRELSLMLDNVIDYATIQNK